MKLEHHTNNPYLMELGIDPAQHGKGVSGAESKRKVEPNWVDRSYHYIAGTAPEAAVGSRSHVYTSEVPDEKIYDFHADPMNLKAKSMWGNTLDRNAYEKNIKDAGYLGYRNPAMGDETMSNAVAIFHRLKPTGIVRKSMSDLHKAKNSKEQRAAVFGVHHQPPRLSEQRMKMMQHIKNVVKHQLGLDLSIAEGKIDPATGKLKTPVSELGEHEKPYNVFTPKGVAEEKARLAQLVEENKQKIATKPSPGMDPAAIRALKKLRAAKGLTPIRRQDPKPDWRSGKLQTQPSPDAAIHEIAHLILSPEGRGLGDTQEDMDREFGRVIANIGFLKQKMTQGEIQPMALENKIRRTMGLPANDERAFRNDRPMAEHNRPVEQALDQPTPRFVRGVAQTNKGPVSADLIRQTRLLSPANSETFDKFIRGEIAFDPEKGWHPATTVNAKINQRARAAANEPDPEKYFARKDKDTLMRSMQKSSPSASKLRELLHRMKSKAMSLHKDTPADQAAASMRSAFGGGSSAPSEPSAPTPSLGASITSGLNHMLGKAEGCGGPRLEALMKLCALSKLRKDTPASIGTTGVGTGTVDTGAAAAIMRSGGFSKSAKWPVPGLVPPSGDKGKGGQHPMQKSEEELKKVYASDAQRRFFHSAGAKKAGITQAEVKEFDQASKGKKLPERVGKSSGLASLQKMSAMCKTLKKDDKSDFTPVQPPVDVAGVN